jgi:hypothetical protein
MNDELGGMCKIVPFFYVGLFAVGNEKNYGTP